MLLPVPSLSNSTLEGHSGSGAADTSLLIEDEEKKTCRASQGQRRTLKKIRQKYTAKSCGGRMRHRHRPQARDTRVLDTQRRYTVQGHDARTCREGVTRPQYRGPLSGVRVSLLDTVPLRWGSVSRNVICRSIVEVRSGFILTYDESIRPLHMR